MEYKWVFLPLPLANASTKEFTDPYPDVVDTLLD